MQNFYYIAAETINFPSMEIKKQILSDQVTNFEIPVKQNRKWEQWVLLMSDEHYDSKHCDRALLRRHHKEAVTRNAIIFKFGDVFDMMGGKYDPRSNKADLRPEFQVADYFSAIARNAANFYRPYKKNIQFISTGNHEASVLKRHEVDILGDFAERIGQTAHPYNGFIRFVFKRESGTIQEIKTLYYNHGSGGNAVVTRGVIKSNRRQNYIHADIIASGHIHSEWILSLPYVEISAKGILKKKEQLHISLGTYKDDSFTGGWADSSEFPPPNMGGTWLRFHYEDGEIKCDAFKAK